MLFPHVQHVAVAVEHLDSVGLAVCDEDPVVVVHGDVVRAQELARIYAGTAPALHILSVAGVLVDVEVAIAVGYVYVTGLSGDRGVRRPVERFASPYPGRHAGCADGHQQLPVTGELGDGVDAVVHTVDRVLRPNVDAVRAVSEDALAEPPREVAVSVEHYYGEVWIAAEGVDVVLRVHRYAGSLDQPCAFRHLVPVQDVLVSEIALA